MFSCLQFEGDELWRTVKNLMASQHNRSNKNLVRDFCDAVLKVVTQPDRSAGGLTGNPQGGQHLTGANRQMRETHPTNHSFWDLYGHLFLPMPQEDLDQVTVICHSFVIVICHSV